MKRNILLFLMPLFFISCNKNKTIKSEKGAIDIISNVYFEASKGLDNHKQFHISKINYLHDDIIELVPNVNDPEFIDSVFYVKDTLFFQGQNILDAKSIIFKEQEVVGNPQSVFTKKSGAVWVNIPIFNYDQRKDIADTVLYDEKPYKRFEINTPDNYSVFYVHQTDTILPYSLNPMADKDYKGRIERIDSYDKKKDLFSTIWLIPREKMDKDAIDIFQFNADLAKQVAERTKKNN